MGFFAYRTEGLSEKKWGYSHETGFVCVMLLVFSTKKDIFHRESVCNSLRTMGDFYSN